MHRLATRAVIAAAFLTAITAAAPTGPTHFSLTLVRDGSTWTATCEAGCAWKALGAHKPRLLGSSIVVDNTGVQLWGAPHDSTVTFAFRVSADGATGWRATSLGGTAWTALTFQCQRMPCRARITEAGVQGLR